VAQSSTRFLVTCLLLAALMGISALSALSASDQPESPDTRRILDNIAATRSRLTPADRVAARRLNAAGDRAYRRHDYAAAFSSYANSYPNAPTAHAYIMAGDSHWRDVAADHSQPASPQAQGAQSCRLDNRHFAHYLAMDLAQNQSVGLALAAQNSTTRESAFYRRARESVACLKGMAQHYEAESPSSCVDLEQLRKCLGPPLI
jgi:hypothetical protein